MAEYEARIHLGTAWERTEVTIETHDRRFIAILEDAVREAFKTAHLDGGDGA